MLTEIKDMFDSAAALALTATLVAIFTGTLVAGSLRRRARRLVDERKARIAREQADHERKLQEIRRYHDERLRALDISLLRKLPHRSRDGMVN